MKGITPFERFVKRWFRRADKYLPLVLPVHVNRNLLRSSDDENVEADVEPSPGTKYEYLTGHPTRADLLCGVEASLGI